MVVLTTMTIIELATAVVAICGAVGAIIHNSRCSKIQCCGVLCEREVKKDSEESNDDKSETEIPTLRPKRNSDFDEALNSIPRK